MRLARGNLLTLAGIVLFWCCLLGSSRTLTAGYNFQDDHQILRIAAEVKTDGVVATARHWIAHDYRFRPVYFGHRVWEAAVLGDNLLSWSIYTAFLAVLSSILFYLAYRALGFSSLESLTSIFFTLMGSQGEVWWRRGPNETIGVVFTALTTLALARSARERFPPTRAAFVAAAVMMSWCKESFILLLPAMLLALVCAVRSAFGMSWKEATRACSAELVGLLSVMAAELAYIKFVLGTEVMGYAGVDGATLAQVWHSGWRYVRASGVWWVVAGMWGLTVLTSKGRRPGRAGLAPGAIALLIIAPQAWLHAKSGVFGRYFLPGSMGVAFLLMVCLREWREHPPRFGELMTSLRLIGHHRSVPRFSREGLSSLAARLSPTIALAGLMLLPVACGQFRNVYFAARAWADEGAQEQRFVDALASSCPRSPILIAGGLDGVYEFFFSIQVYLEYLGRQNDARFYFVHPDGPLVPFEEDEVWEYRKASKCRIFDSATNPVEFTCVGLLAGKDDEAVFLSRAAGWFRLEDYTLQQVGSDRYPYKIYTRR